MPSQIRERTMSPILPPTSPGTTNQGVLNRLPAPVRVSCRRLRDVDVEAGTGETLLKS
jgi:hypothetical protein